MFLYHKLSGVIDNFRKEVCSKEYMHTSVIKILFLIYIKEKGGAEDFVTENIREVCKIRSVSNVSIFISRLEKKDGLITCAKSRDTTAMTLASRVYHIKLTEKAERILKPLFK